MKRKTAYLLITFLFVVFMAIIPLYPYLMPVNHAVRSFIGATLFRPFFYVAVFLHNSFETFLSTVQTIIWTAVILFVLKDLRGSALLVTSMSFQAIVANSTKLLARIPRPPQEYFGIFHHTFAYPSGHTSTSLTFAVMLTYILCYRTKWKYGRLVSGIYIVLAILTPYSRLYLDVHWISDIIGGWVVGGFICLSVIAFEKKLFRSIQVKRY